MQRTQLRDSFAVARHGQRLTSGDPFEHIPSVVPQLPDRHLVHSPNVSPVRRAIKAGNYGTAFGTAADLLDRNLQFKRQFRRQNGLTESAESPYRYHPCCKGGSREDSVEFHDARNEIAAEQNSTIIFPLPIDLFGLVKAH